MTLSSFPLSLSRNRAYLWWLRLWSVSARTLRHMRLSRTVASNDPIVQSKCLLECGYYNAAVAMSRFAIEKRLDRLALITPDWEKFRAKRTESKILFTYKAGGFDKKSKRRLSRFSSRVNKYVHSTVIGRERACRIVREAEGLIPIFDKATAVLLVKGGQPCQS